MRVALITVHYLGYEVMWVLAGASAAKLSSDFDNNDALTDTKAGRRHLQLA
jgi:hypothetical protein